MNTSKFRSWLRSKIDELDFLQDYQPDPEVREEAGIIAREAGNRAAGLGLTALYQLSRNLRDSITAQEAKAYLSECLAGSVDESALTPPQAAKLLKVSPDKVLNWIRSGELRAVNVSGGRPKYRIAREDLQAFTNRRTPQPRPKPKRVRSSWTGKTYY